MDGRAKPLRMGASPDQHDLMTLAIAPTPSAEFLCLPTPPQLLILLPLAKRAQQVVAAGANAPATRSVRQAERAARRTSGKIPE